eukprot:GCRY01002059.1.p1 GENE.GCRY01002059.1~~GCRY01002059.1.p1  ORF type:complete len:265 (+),score=18.85 GCRY01002059.1:232-1026(+)
MHSFCPDEFQKLIPKSEEYVFHLFVYKTSKEHRSVLLFTTTTLFKITEACDSITWKKDIKEIDLVETKTDEDLLRIYIPSRTGGKISDVDANARDYHVISDVELWFYVLAIQRLVVNAWQKVFEENLVPEPEIYATHGHVLKINRRGAKQFRHILVSSHAMYNVEPKKSSVDPSKIKWRVPLLCISKVIHYRDPCKLTIIHEGTKTAGLLKRGTDKVIKETIHYVFPSPERLQNVVHNICRCYFIRTHGRELTVLNQPSVEFVD